MTTKLTIEFIRDLEAHHNNYACIEKFEGRYIDFEDGTWLCTDWLDEWEEEYYEICEESEPENEPLWLGYAYMRFNEEREKQFSEKCEVTDGLGNWFFFESAVNLMDDEIREQLNYELAPCTPQKFFDKYLGLHYEKFDEEFEVN